MFTKMRQRPNLLLSLLESIHGALHIGDPPKRPYQPMYAELTVDVTVMNMHSNLRQDFAPRNARADSEGFMHEKYKFAGVKKLF